jgi:hypothetical protein
MNPEFEAAFAQMRAQYEESLREMPLPPGAEEHLRERVAAGDSETLLFMLKLAWVFGAQNGYASAQAAQRQAANPPKRVLA